MKKFGLLGEKLAHSYSPEIHAGFGDYPYDLFEVAPNDLKDFFRSTSWSGINVTIPYKQAVIAFCDELSGAARGIGSVNTIIRREDGTLYGDNTDAYGFAYLIKDMVVKDKKILVLGSGGSSKTVVHVLKEKGAGDIIVVSRTGADHYDNLVRHYDDTHVIVNTTPVGMYPDNGNAPLSLQYFSNLEVVVDLIYNPNKTTLLLDAEALEMRAICGLPMLVAQAAKASELFIDRPVATGRIDKIVHQMHCQMQNLILIGMPGSGKTTVATELSRMTGRKIVDTDGEIVKLAGKSITEIFAEDGEAKFREYEATIIKRCGAEAGLIIATGGGCVKTADNYDALRQNGVVIWLERPVTELPRDGRPLSTGDLEIMYQERKPLYDHFADKMVVNDRTVKEVANEVWRCFNENFSC